MTSPASRLRVLVARCVFPETVERLRQHFDVEHTPDDTLFTKPQLIERLRGIGIHCVFHYIPLHDAPAGRRFGRAHGELTVTEDIADRLVRLPLWLGMEDVQAEIIQQVLAAL